MDHDPFSLTDCEPAERHRRVAARFGELIASTDDWSAPTPVPEWRTKDIVDHLLGWFPAFLASGGIELDDPSDRSDRVASWAAQAAAIQELLDDPATADGDFTHPMAGTHRLADAVDRFYTGDVVMHTWDLARSMGTDPGLDPEFCRQMVEGMRPLDEMLRASGQYGPAQPVAADAAPPEQLMAFVGRDPNWSPRSAS